MIFSQKPRSQSMTTIKKEKSMFVYSVLRYMDSWKGISCPNEKKNAELRSRDLSRKKKRWLKEN